ncbi:hypothetical protein BCR44DRAFT_1271293 [Catenaria anguillulae PL171]|uniref:Uncharacterized protein n=1 Tax=Catenaria anguillulae PL171 TaxID=765915 RepID=A0A1Y2HZC0_9FUNG|nr:hypothetical protein BCR44DRAFT_1271293 [Catenaria anguillulae PL171]
MSRSPSAASDGSPVRSKDFAARLRERLESHTSSIAIHHSTSKVSRPSASLVLLANRNPTSMPAPSASQVSQSLYHSPIPYPEVPNSPSSSNWKITLRPKTRSSVFNAIGGNNANLSSSRHLAGTGVLSNQPALVSHQPTVTSDAVRYLAVGAGQLAAPLPDPGSLLSVISSGDCSGQVSVDSSGKVEASRLIAVPNSLARASFPTQFPIASTEQNPAVPEAQVYVMTSAVRRRRPAAAQR